jgi:hypothetical protein
VNDSTGELSGAVKPYNEYYLLPYLATTLHPTDAKAKGYFDTYCGVDGKPVGDGTYPVEKAYADHSLLTDNPNAFMSSFVPQFGWFQSQGFHSNPYYARELFPAWLEADALWWSNALAAFEAAAGAPAAVWGVDVSGQGVFGCGGGDSPTGYSVERIEGSPDLVFSAAVMAGFLGAANSSSAVTSAAAITSSLRWMYAHLAYETALGPRVVWRYSVAQPEWRATLADSIDYSTLVLGLALVYLPDDFYASYAA